jgi:hypothetical protein
MMVKMTAIGSERIESPDPSGRKTNGRKAKIRIAVQPKTARPICLVASTAATLLLMPPPHESFDILYHYDTITLTSRPSATMKPTMLN